MITAIYIGTERLDLYADENIVIKSNVTKIEDITKIFTDTSNDFTVPANDKNNAIFKHWYNADLINGFDARKKVPAVIELGGLNFKVGKIRLQKVNFKHNAPDSYSLDFFGNLVELKDSIGDDKLSDLNIPSLDFTFNDTTIKDKIQNKSDVCFSLLSKRRLLYQSIGVFTETDKQTNIYYDGTDNENGIKLNDLTASIKQLLIIEAIEDKYNLSFSRDFFGGYDFSNQYLALSGNAYGTPTQVPLKFSDDPSQDGDAIMVNGDLLAENENTKSISFFVNIRSEYNDVEFTIFVKNGDEVIAEKTLQTNTSLISVYPSNVDGLLENVTFWISSASPLAYQHSILRSIYDPNTSYNFSDSTIYSTSLDVSSKLPDIKIIDYLSGLFKMSKLVAIPQKDGSIYVENLTDFYRNGKVYDLTNYINYNNHTVSVGTINNEISYKFQEPQTLLAHQFKLNNDLSYGDLELGIYDEFENLIEGDSLTFQLPFEQVVYEKIIDNSVDDFDTNIQYGLLLDEKLDEVTIKPHIHYIENFDTEIKYSPAFGLASKLTSANIPTHVLSTSLQTFSTTFGTEFNEFNGAKINNTLLSNYHLPYIQSIFSQNKREYEFKAIDVPTDIVLKLGLNDVILIKDKYFRIESFSTNTLNNNIDFKLINDRIVDLNPSTRVSMDSVEITMDNVEITMDRI